MKTVFRFENGLYKKISVEDQLKARIYAEKYLISVSPEKIKDLLQYIDSLEDEVLFLEDQL